MTRLRKPSAAEVEILRILWDREPASVRTVHEETSKSKDVGYTTILKQLQRMHDKGLVSREPGEGKAYNYRAAVPMAETRSQLVGRLLQSAFRGNVNDLVMNALGQAQSSPEDLEALKQFIASIESKNGGEDAA